MQDNIYERIHNTLTWKRIIGFNAVLFMVLIVPISVQLAQQDTENRSGAAEEAPVIIPPANYPKVPPKIDRVSAFFGKTGDTVVLLGANFGDYQWESKVYVGATLANKESIVRWSNNILEVKIPEGARTGQVWVVINGQEAKWDGSLLLTDVARAAQIGLQKLSSTNSKIYTINAGGAVRGMVELSYVSEPLTFSPAANVTILSQTPSSDSLGKKLKIMFEMIPLSSVRTELGDFSYPGIGSIEIVRAELFDQSGKMLSIFSDPLSIKVTP